MLTPPTYAVIDVETTGLSPRTDRILELAIVRTSSSGVVVDEWVSRFDPEGPVGATHIHGITADDVLGAPLFRDVVPQIIERLSGMVIAAHNARFDAAFLNAELERAGWEIDDDVPGLCTMELSGLFLPGLARQRLADCCSAAGVLLEGAHSALGDARATAGLIGAFARGRHSDSLDRIATPLARKALGVRWPAEATLPVATPPVRTQRWAAPPPAAPLVERVTTLSQEEILADGAPDGTAAYVEALCAAFEDGLLSMGEATGLVDLTRAYRLADGDLAAAHHAFITALAYCALDDGFVNKAEKEELCRIASALDVDHHLVPDLVAAASAARAARIASTVRDIPADWNLGTPLKFGDRIVFTGAFSARPVLETQARERGMRVTGSVSRFTTVLVTDGSFTGNKATKAAALGTQVVGPEAFERMLEFVQPAI